MPVEVINDTNNSVVATVYVGNDPSGLAYDPYDGDVYAANELSDNLTAISDASDSVVGNYSGFDQPSGAAYLPAQHEIDVADSANDSVSSFYPPAGDIQDNTTVGGVPIGVVYVPFYGTGFPLVLNYATANVSLLDSGSAYVDYNILLAQTPDGIAYDSYSNELFSANDLYSGTVDIINDTINRFPPASAAVGHFPVGVAYDTSNANVYVTNSGSDRVSVISAFNNSVYSTIPVGSAPWGIAYDPTNAQIWVANAGSDNISVISVTPRTKS
jgi:YVTN family beta-propeller protein